MENPFKKVIHSEKLPDIIKNRVMDDINVIKLALDVTDLLTIKYPEAINDILNFSNKNKNKSD
ncbi:hypothetical protein C1T31_12200 [Hanstruepera neustonica]|uniref:Uncharacterized protein n=1 Tax=Hanstruepera neustonica TaxID=1445657 RepID=A0A2K1DW92_9FLAO|nr:hypothetical protein [Hanstruepera neustonica]PNQ72306.1 hypothetical protein C1T31_12200 [Hanstruepera neustonica]